MRLPVLMYHHVGPQRPGTDPEMTVSPEEFRRQARWWAAAGYAGITPSDWLVWREQRKEGPRKTVLFTFDDAYAELDTYALPTLQECGLSAAIYCVTRKLGQSNDWDASAGFAGHSLMAADRVQYWAARGFEFGSHTRTHPDLRAVSEQQLEDEIGGSASDLKQLLGRSALSFAYPYGRFDERVKRIVERHYRMAFSIEEGVNQLSTDLYALRRIGVRPGDWRVDPRSIAFFGFSLRHRVRRAAGRLLRSVGLAPRRGSKAPREATYAARRTPAP